jgi:hypothetical protein
MAAGEATIRIASPPRDAFSVICDVEHNHRWSSTSIQGWATSPGPMGVGSTAHEISRFLGRRLEVDSEVVEFEPDRLLGVVTRGGPFPIHVTFRVDPVDGGSQVAVAFEAQPTGPIRLVDGLVSALVRRTFATDLANLKRLLESAG